MRIVCMLFAVSNAGQVQLATNRSSDSLISMPADCKKKDRKYLVDENEEDTELLLDGICII